MREAYRWSEGVRDAQRATLGDNRYAYDRPLAMMAARPGLELPAAPFRVLQANGATPYAGPSESEYTAVVRGSTHPHAGYGKGGSLQKFHAPPFGIAQDPGPSLDEAYITPMGKTGHRYKAAYLGTSHPILGGGFSGGTVYGPVPAFHGFSGHGPRKMPPGLKGPFKHLTPGLKMPHKSRRDLYLWGAVAVAAVVFGMRSQAA